MKITKNELQALINKVGLTSASKQLKCGYLTIKRLCIRHNIIVEKKQAGRKKNIDFIT